MSDILLVEEKIDDSVRLLNKVSNLSPEIRIAKIIDNKKELIENLSNNDILIIDYEIFKKLLRNEILRIRNYMKYVVIIYDKTVDVPTNIKHCLYVDKKDVISFFMNIIRNIDENVKEIIRKELQYLGYNLSYCGTKYLIDSIYYAYKEGEFFDGNLTRKIYPIVAKKYSKTCNNIKCNITRATDMMFYECEEIKLLKYLKFQVISKPGTKLIIEAILNKINSEKE